MDETVKKDEVLKRPKGMPLHWLYFIFYGLSMSAALWQHAEPTLTIVLLALILPSAALIYIPYSILGHSTRYWLQISVMLLSACWGIFRCTQHVPIDKVLIETVCLMGFGFAFTLRNADYSYIMLLSILLVVYGALIPRSAYLILLPLSAAVGVLIMYHSRTMALAEDLRIAIPKGIFRHNWMHITLHLFLSGIIFAAIYFSLPVSPKPGKGVIEVSFRNENDNAFSQDFGKWVKSEHMKKSKDAKKTVQGDTPDTVGTEGKIVSGPKGQSMYPDGSGAGQPGNEIVFRAKSPLKLYWLGQLYDTYDGLKWTASNKMKMQDNTWRPELWKYTRRIEQKIIMEKWVSNVMFGAHEASYINIPVQYADKVKRNFYQTRFIDGVTLPGTPFTYTVLSNIMTSDNIQEDDKKVKSLWVEKIQPLHYTLLPDKKISQRVKDLAASITAGAETNYEKAIALRDYLRKTYPYKQFSKKTPEKAESVDYFLFELKEGHCEYFASALTVLVRLNKIPARVATGFSPGDYNVLNNCFEVHEYHAHAWTQIFIEDKGWLTFDAVPPGNIQSRTIPLAIGKFHDPFGDEWKVTPPEITEDVKNFFKEEADMETAGDDEDFSKKLPPALRVMVAIASIPEKIGAFIDNAKEKYLKKSSKDKLKMQDVIKLITANLKLVAQNIAGACTAFAKWLISKNGMISCMLIILFVIMLYILKYLKIIARRKLKLYRCMRMYENLGRNAQSDPQYAVTAAYRICRELLLLSGLPRRNNMELFAYGTSLRKVDYELSSNFLAICNLYSRTIYDKRPISKAEAAEAVASTGKVREVLMHRIKK